MRDIETRNEDRLHLGPIRTSRARNVFDRQIKAYSINYVSQQIKCLIDLYNYEYIDINF